MNLTPATEDALVCVLNFRSEMGNMYPIPVMYLESRQSPDSIPHPNCKCSFRWSVHYWKRALPFYSKILRMSDLYINMSCSFGFRRHIRLLRLAVP